jgi:hypothetical protein
VFLLQAGMSKRPPRLAFGTVGFLGHVNKPHCRQQFLQIGLKFSEEFICIN